MIEEAFARGDSSIQRVDPRTRIAYAVIYSTVVAILTGLESMVAALAISVSLVLVARLGISALIKRLLVFNSIIALFWLVVPFTFGGEALFSVGPLTAGREGLTYSIAVTLKSNSIFLALLALVATMSVAETGYALQRLGFPVKIVTLLLLTYRYVFVIEQEYLRLVRAVKARGFEAGSNLHTYRTYAYLVGMLFVRSWDRAERVHRAMRCRGFDGRFYCLREYRLSFRDLAFAGAAGFGLLLVGVAEWVQRIC